LIGTIDDAPNCIFGSGCMIWAVRVGRHRAESCRSLQLRASLTAIFKADFQILEIGRLALRYRLLKAGHITLVGNCRLCSLVVHDH